MSALGLLVCAVLGHLWGDPVQHEQDPVAWRLCRRCGLVEHADYR